MTERRSDSPIPPEPSEEAPGRYGIVRSREMRVQTPDVQDAAVIRVSEVETLLAQVRPAWRAKDLINRVYRLLPVDPSSACQRLFNAAIHDLREKVVVAGVDIAKQAAAEYKLPPVERPEDVETYSTSKLIDLAYRMGLLGRPEWRRLTRVYEIRRDLEHEDDEYVAGVEDVLYVFKTCVEVVLARDPVQVLRVTDIKDIVGQPAPAKPSGSLLDDYQHAPQPRQEEILGFLINTALDNGQPDVVRQNALAMLHALRPLTQNPVLLAVTEKFQKKLARDRMTHIQGVVASAAGILPYIKQTQRADLFETIYADFKSVTPDWRSNANHGDLLRSLQELGGLRHVPRSVREKFVEWMVIAYLGEPGGRTSWGNIRHVYYSDSAAPLIRELIMDAGPVMLDDIRRTETLPRVKVAVSNTHIARRFQDLLDFAQARLTNS